MNKLLLILLFFISAGYAKGDSLDMAQVYIDKTSKIEARHFDSGFKSNYKDKSFIYEYKAPEKSAWDKFKEAIAQFLNELFGNAFSGISAKTISTIFYCIVGLIIVFVIYLIVKTIMNKEGKWAFGKSSDKKIIDYSDMEKNIHNVNFEKLIQEAMAQGNNRLVIRFYYLWLLKKMTDNNIIEWDIEKTNSDYFHEIKSEKLKDDFSYLSYLYNYIWYGEFELTEDTFSKTRKSFETTFQSLA
ncbi:DUF4129 domain-containing protein [Flavobacterium amniphilum]|uniref:DUF4129 domain-containing protein n=1 Tax=Flavobacterium amniphilum TaxID=1834035 RepID=UPI00202A5E4C|nr:DUF4129 domain-containing protein [Flavobacterium amniphilum]